MRRLTRKCSSLRIPLVFPFIVEKGFSAVGEIIMQVLMRHQNCVGFIPLLIGLSPRKRAI